MQAGKPLSQTKPLLSSMWCDSLDRGDPCTYVCSEGLAEVKWSPPVQACSNLQADESVAASLRNDGGLWYLLFSRTKTGCWIEQCAILGLSLLGPTGCHGILPRWPPVALVMWDWHSVCGADGFPCKWYSLLCSLILKM